jgi:hypothetical protein
MSSRYQSLLVDVENGAVEWRWFSDYALDPRPLYFYLNGSHWPPGRPLNSAPTLVKSGQVLIAIDEVGRPLLAREAIRFSEKPATYYDTFYRYLHDGLETLHYSYSKHEPIYYERTFDENSVPQVRVSTAQRGRKMEWLRWDRGRLVEVEMEHGPEREDVRPWARLVVTYDSAGSVHEVWQEWLSGGREREYPPGKS